MIARRLRQYFITGLLVWLPMAVTIWVLTWLYGLLDGIFLSVLGAADAVIPGLHTLADAQRALACCRWRSSSWSPACLWPTFLASGGCASGTS
jgi:hypothetical protein